MFARQRHMPGRWFSLREVVDRRHVQSGAALPRLRNSKLSPTLRRAVERARNHAAYASASRQLGLHPDAHERPEDLDPRLAPEHVPQLFWAAETDQQVMPLFGFDDFSPWLVRRFCSVLLVRMLTPMRWRDAVRFLGYPDAFLNDGYNTTFAKLRAHDRFDTLGGRVRQIANVQALVDGGLIDYAQRRDRLSDWPGLDPETWQLVARRGQAPVVDSSLRRTRASVWLWCQLTSGHRNACPIALPTRAIGPHTTFERLHVSNLRQPARRRGSGRGATSSTCRSAIESWPSSAPTPVLTSPPFATAQRGSSAPACVSHARRLAARLLWQFTNASWTGIATVLSGSHQRLAINDRACVRRLDVDAASAREFEQLVTRIADWQRPAPTPPTKPHPPANA